MDSEALLVFMGLMIPTIGVLVMVIYLRKFINIERMAMIEKGVDPQLFNLSKPRYTAGALRASLLMIGGGVGLLMGVLLDKSWDMEEAGYFSMLFICGGIGLGAAYVVEEKKIKEEKSARV